MRLFLQCATREKRAGHGEPAMGSWGRAWRAQRVGGCGEVTLSIERVDLQPVHGFACNRINAAALQDLVDAGEPFGFGGVGKPAAQGKEIICHAGDLVRTGGACELLTIGQGHLVA